MKPNAIHHELMIDFIAWSRQNHDCPITTHDPQWALFFNGNYFTDIIRNASFFIKNYQMFAFFIHILIKQNSNIKQNHSLSYFLIFINKFKRIDWKK